MSEIREFHILQITDKAGSRTFRLDAATYSIGRDKFSNAIVVSDIAVSRNHAMMLPMPSKGNQYIYQIVDGDVTGRPSTNGILVNKLPCSSKTLKTGDSISMGDQVKMAYMIAHIIQKEFDQFFGAINPEFHSLKAEFIDPTDTIDPHNSDMKTSVFHSLR
jgi:pSer/pThr/pTyr-binding forkhead associated (FHA) protein